MDKVKVAYFSSHYETLDEWDLYDINVRRSTLTEEACIALDQTLLNKGIDLSKLKEEENKEQAQQKIKSERRDSRYLKLLWIISLPIIILGAFFRTGNIYGALISSLVQCGLLGIFHWGYLKFKQSRSRRRP